MFHGLTVWSIEKIRWHRFGYSNRHADLMFELISRRYQNKSTLVTTNRPFAEWREVFPNAACVVSLVDRFPRNAETIPVEVIPIGTRKPASAPNSGRGGAGPVNRE